MATSPHRNRPYHWLAEYYDDIFNLHHAWFDDARRKILGRALSTAASGCDLCCGPGRAAVQLALRGIRMYGVDRSLIMCRQAREKAKAAGASLKVIHADMRDFKLPEPVDFMICEYDALNHLDKASDLASVARCVARSLKPGGYFYFDVNHTRAFTEVWGNTWMVDLPDVALIMHGGFKEETGKGFIDVHWFVRNGKLWQRHFEYIEQVAWTGREVRDHLAASGFGAVRAWDATPFFEGDSHITPGCRTFFRARRL